MAFKNVHVELRLVGEINTFTWLTDPFGNLYVVAYDIESRRPEVKLTGF